MADISLLPKEYTVKVSSVSPAANKLNVLASIFLILILASWGGLYFYNGQLAGQINKISNEIQSISLKGRDQEVAKINEADQKLGSFKGILDSHIYSSDIFSDIEKVTLKNVYFDKFSLSANKNELFLSGVAQSYTSFAKQLDAFKTKSNFVRNIEIQSTRLSKEGVEFSFKILLIDGILIKK